MENVSYVQVLWALGLAALILFAVKRGRRTRALSDADKLLSKGQTAIKKAQKKGGKLNVCFKAKTVTAVSHNNGAEVTFFDVRHTQSDKLLFSETRFCLFYALSGNHIYMTEKRPTMEEALKLLGAKPEQVIAIGSLVIDCTNTVIVSQNLEINDETHAYFIDWDLKVD